MNRLKSIISYHIKANLLKRTLGDNKTSKIDQIWSNSLLNSEKKALNLKSNDVFLVSFPRSGNTWVRTIVANILYPQEWITSLQDLDYLVPDLHRELPEHEDYSFPRVVKTHRSYPCRHQRNDKSLYSKVIYIVRHPINVIRSLYHYRLYKNPNISLDQVVLEVVASNNQWGGSWQEHILSWKAKEDDIDILFVRYEDLENQSLKSIIEISEFLGYEISNDKAEVIMHNSSREAMIKMEKRGPLKEKDFEFIRRDRYKRKTKEDLDDNMKQFVKDALGYSMKKFGYQVDKHQNIEN